MVDRPLVRRYILHDLLGRGAMGQVFRIGDSGHHLLAAAAADGSFGLRGLVPELAKSKCGLVLAPASATDGTVLGARLPASVFAPGVTLRGALVHHGRVTAVQVPAWPDDPADGGWPEASRAAARTEGEHGRVAW